MGAIWSLPPLPPPPPFTFGHTLEGLRPDKLAGLAEMAMEMEMEIGRFRAAQDAPRQPERMSAEDWYDRPDEPLPEPEQGQR